MQLQFMGANRQVTGSRYLLQVEDKRVLVDCGMFQEREYLERNWEVLPIDPQSIHALVLTHVHIDHSGLIPRLVKSGFSGTIYATRPTVGLAEILLRDSARIQMDEAAYKQRRHRKEGRHGKHPEIPLYVEEDVDAALKLFQPAPYRKTVAVSDQIDVQFHDAGHILGSAMLHFRVREGNTERTIIFSGDIGRHDKPFIRDPSYFDQADVVVMESTYGDRMHENGGNIEQQLEAVISKTVGRGGNIIIPTFALERAQELMYCISRLVHADRIPDIPIYLDSPMAVDVTELFHDYPDCFDAETWELINSKESPLHFPGLRLCRTVDESRAISSQKMPCIIMSTSGMCTNGRIKHHLRHNIGRPECTVLFVGYQSRGTLGRLILDGVNPVRIHGRNWPVRAEIAQIFGFSGHADRAELLEWAGHFTHPPKQLFLTHGEEEAAEALQQELQQRGFPQVVVPEYLDSVQLD